MRGFDTEWVIELDILSFNELFESVLRLDSSTRAETVYAQLLASQGDGKEVIKWIKQRYYPMMQGGKAEEKPVQEKAFLAKFGKGL